MAINKIVYFPNPLTSETLGNTHTVSTSTTDTDTILTVAATNEYKRVKSFCVTVVFVSGGVTDRAAVTLKIGSGYYTYSTGLGHASNALVEEIITSSGIGFDSGFLQPADTITISTELVDISNNATITTSVLMIVDDYYTT